MMDFELSKASLHLRETIVNKQRQTGASLLCSQLCILSTSCTELEQWFIDLGAPFDLTCSVIHWKTKKPMKNKHLKTFQSNDTLKYNSVVVMTNVFVSFFFFWPFQFPVPNDLMIKASSKPFVFTSKVIHSLSPLSLVCSECTGDVIGAIG